MGQRIWKTFSKYHYLDGKLSINSDCFVGVYNNKLISFCAVKQLPYFRGKKTIHRLVVLPQFQGVGIGTKFLDEISKIYIKKNWEVHITTSNKGLIHSLKRNNHWKSLGTKLNSPVRGGQFRKRLKRTQFKGGTDLSNCFSRQISSFKTNKELWS